MLQTFLKLLLLKITNQVIIDCYLYKLILCNQEYYLKKNNPNFQYSKNKRQSNQ